MWQIFEFSIHKKFPPLEQLTIHFFREQLVYFKENVIAKEF